MLLHVCTALTTISNLDCMLKTYFSLNQKKNTHIFWFYDVPVPTTSAEGSGDLEVVSIVVFESLI